MNLENLRKKIDEIDREIVSLYERRMDVSRQVAEYKIECGKPVFDRGREEEKICSVKSMVRDDFNEQGIEELFRQIMALSRKLQYRMLKEAGKKGEFSYSGNSIGTIKKELVVYKDTGEGWNILWDMIWLAESWERAKKQGVWSCAGSMETLDAGVTEAVGREMAVRLYSCVQGLLELAGNCGFHGNLWHCYLADLMVNHENSYSKACETKGAVQGSVNRAVLHDMEIFRGWFDYDWKGMADELGVDALTLVLDYEGCEGEGGVYSGRIGESICELAADLGEMRTAEKTKERVTRFYGEYGVGSLGLHKAFRVVHDEGGVRIVPITNMAKVSLGDLVGYEIAKKKLVENTEAFVSGRCANNCLLYGDAGTGKSSSIKGIVNEYYGRGLRMIEVYKHQCRDLNEVVALIKNRNYKFIIYMDDLSFEDFEVEYKYLKAVIEGGLEKKPDNVLIYATSNRRHLVREKFSDKEDRSDDLHKSDTVQEKLSLAARFGVSIYFGTPERKEYHHIVKVLAEKNHILMKEGELIREADRWEMVHGGMSGRTAQQFIDYCSGRQSDPIINMY